MDIKHWHRSRGKSVRLGRDYSLKKAATTSMWVNLWRKIKGANKSSKKKQVWRSSSVKVQASYDANNYLQNFDEGSGRAEPDVLCRSFSARFANPSSISFRKEVML